MSQIRMLVTLRNNTEASRENDCTNTFYLDTDELGTTPDYEALATDTAALFNAQLPNTTAHRTLNVRAYDMDDPIPREPHADVSVPRPSSPSDPGPREVALCLSYYADRNLPRQRGRMYIGPWNATAMADRPDGILMQRLGTLAEGISGLGGINVQWVQHSEVAGTYSTVTNWWVDNAWDTMRSRGQEASTRITGEVNG
jgi:hypothetical protein